MYGSFIFTYFLLFVNFHHFLYFITHFQQLKQKYPTYRRYTVNRFFCLLYTSFTRAHAIESTFSQLYRLSYETGDDAFCTAAFTISLGTRLLSDIQGKSLLQDVYKRQLPIQGETANKFAVELLIPFQSTLPIQGETLLSPIL